MSDEGYYVDPSARLGTPLRMLQGCVWSKSRTSETRLELPKKIFIGAFATVGEGVVLGEEVVVDAFCCIEPRARIGYRTILIYRAIVGSDAVIGQDCVIGGFIPEDCKIGDRCRIMGKLVHAQQNPLLSWDHLRTPERSPRVEDEVFVGTDALVIGGVTLHKRSYVCAGSIVTRDVPERHIAYATNEIIPFREWKGSLRESPFFGDGEGIV